MVQRGRSQFASWVPHTMAVMVHPLAIVLSRFCVYPVPHTESGTRVCARASLWGGDGGNAGKDGILERRPVDRLYPVLLPAVGRPGDIPDNRREGGVPDL